MAEVSILMSVKNGLPYLEETMQSVLAQSFRDFEFIIIDDGSTDATAEVVRSFSDDRIRLIQQENTGVAKARNKAFPLTSGRYIAIIDADDLWLPQKLEKQLEFLKTHSEYVLTGCFVNIIDKEGNYLYTEKKPVSDEENRKFLDIKNTWTHSSILFTREVFEKIGGYYEPVKQYIVDYMLVYQMARYGKVHQLPEVLARYRIVPTSLSTKADSPEFKELMFRSLKRGYVTQEDQEKLAAIKITEKKTSNFKESMYHLYLGRSYLFHNYQKSKSVHHLKKCLELNPEIKIARIYLWMARLLPRTVVQKIYSVKSPIAGYTEVRQ